jgi:hypothetical protein
VVEGNQRIGGQPQEHRRDRGDRTAGADDNRRLPLAQAAGDVLQRCGDAVAEPRPGLAAGPLPAGADPQAERVVEDLLELLRAQRCVPGAVLEPRGDLRVVGEDVAVVVFVPAIVDRQPEAERVGIRLRGLSLAAQITADDVVRNDPASLQPLDERVDLLMTMSGQDVVVRRAERRLRVADQQDAWNRRAARSCTRPTLWESGPPPAPGQAARWSTTR